METGFLTPTMDGWEEGQVLWTFWVWIGLLHLVQGMEISTISLVMAPAKLATPLAIAPGPSPTSAACPHAGPLSRAASLSRQPGDSWAMVQSAEPLDCPVQGREHRL